MVGRVKHATRPLLTDPGNELQSVSLIRAQAMSRESRRCHSRGSAHLGYGRV